MIIKKTKFSFPTTIFFGPGVRHDVAENLLKEKLSRPLIVTDRGIVGLPFFSHFSKSLDSEKLKVATFSDISGNPVKSQVLKGVEAYRDHQADCLIGIGGGAALDVTKAIALLINHTGDLFDYEDEKPGALPVTERIPFWVALPTTSGTGSEVGRSTVISDDTTHIKKIIFSPSLLAKMVFADPELTLALPAHITAATGVDAFTHCVESYLAKGYHPICDGIALEGIRLSAQHLKICVKDATNLEARSQMMMASMMGAIAFQKGLGLTHSCAHALSTVADLHHGLANGIMIDHALAFNLQSVPERFTKIAEIIGLSDKTGEAFISWLTQWKKELGIPANLKEAKLSHELIPRLSQLAFQDSCHLSNPRDCTERDFTHIFTEAF
ncbi:MAG: iron-containing alcohol dehydrogenase [Proteobacteria bacterium]|nr:iron-containing alcohol dehydrogenase [Pseudomonadota bacterium]